MTTWDAVPEKATPVNDDEILLIDTEDSRNQKRATIAAIQNPTGIFGFSDSSTQQSAAVPSNNTGFLETASQTATFDFSSLSTTSLGHFWKRDGTAMYIVAFDKDVYQYTVPTPWDISSIVSAPTSFTVSTDFPFGLYFRYDGLKMYTITNPAADPIVQSFDLSTAWDVTTAVAGTSFSITEDTSSAPDLYLHPEGTLLYVLDNDNDRLLEYPLATAWDVSSAISVTTTSIAEDTDPISIFFREDGTKMYLTGSQNDSAYEYDLSTPWDSTTISYNGNTLPVPQATTIGHLFINYFATKMYIVNQTLSEIYEYDLGLYAEGDIVSENAVEGATVKANDTFTYRNGSTQPFAALNDYTLADLNTATLFDTKDISNESQALLGIDFYNNGLTLFVASSTAGDGGTPSGILQYDFTEPYNASTATFTSNIPFTASGTAVINAGVIDSITLGDGGLGYDFGSPPTVTITGDGTGADFTAVVDANGRVTGYTQVSGGTGYTTATVSVASPSFNDVKIAPDRVTVFAVFGSPERIYQFKMGTEGDITTLDLDNPEVIHTPNFNSPQGISWHPDGKKLFLIRNGTIWEEDVSNAFDLTDATYNNVFRSTSGLITFPRNITFTHDGNDFYIGDTGVSPRVIAFFTCSTPYDFVTAIQQTSIETEVPSPCDVYITPDNSKYFTCDFNDNAFFEFNLGMNIRGTAKFDGPWSLSVTPTAVDFSEDSNTVIIGVTDNSAARTVTISSADITNQKSIIVKDQAGTAASANNITVATEGSETIDGASTVDIVANYGVLRLYSDGSNLFSW